MRLSRIFEVAIAGVLLMGVGRFSMAADDRSDVTSPSAHLGHPVGIDFHLPDWEAISSYLRLLGEQSPRVETKKVGTTTEGRDFLISIISSEANLANLDAIKAHAKTLADPRGKSQSEIDEAVQNGKLVFFVSCQMHSNEAAGSQFGIEFAHMLATSDEEPWKSARDEIVVVLYMTNPDGIDHVSQWYHETVGTPYEGSGMLKLYQYYAGHDNNRDWFMLTQNETRIVTKLLYTEWFPQIYWDVHQQGSSEERFFVPPYRDPLNPNLDSNIITGIDALGSRALMDLTRAGFTGVSTGVSYDMWWNGGNRNVPVRHNIIGILTEAASVDLASPIFLPLNRLRSPGSLAGYHPSNQFPKPWPGGWWRLRDIIDYEMAFGESLLGSMTREPELWRTNAHDAAVNSIEAGEEEAPHAWIIPSDNRDPDAVARFVDVLMATGVELGVSSGEVVADGRTYPAGSIVIDRAQPYGQHVKDLMDVQRYPDGAPPYDVAGWTLPSLLGVRRVEVVQPWAEEPAVEAVTSIDAAMAEFGGDTRLDGRDSNRASLAHSSTWTRLAKALESGQTVRLSHDDGSEGLVDLDASGDVTSPVTELKKMPRIGVYAPWSGSMDEGWLRYVLDSYEIPYITVRNEMLRAGRLDDFLDVLIIASESSRELDDGRRPGSIMTQYERGLDPEGAIAVEEFVRGGGNLITMASSAHWAIDLLELPISDVTRGSDFSCPGSVLRGMVHSGRGEQQALTAGLPESVALFFSRSSAWKVDKDAAINATTLLSYAPTRLLLSGWIQNPEVIEEQGAWLRVEYGEGQVHLFGFRPQYRGWSQQTFHLLFRAIFMEPVE